MSLLRRALLLALIAIFMPAVNACAESGLKKLIEELVELSNEQADILNSINTLEDVEKAKPAHMRVMNKGRALSRKLEPYKDQMNKEELFKSELGQRLNEAQMRMQNALDSLETRLDKKTMEAVLAMMNETGE